MTICHSPEEIHQTQNIDALKRNGILTDTCITISECSFTSQSNLKPDKVLPILLLIRNYNQYLGESDGYTQIRQYYSFNTCFFWYWWLFLGFL